MNPAEADEEESIMRDLVAEPRRSTHEPSRRSKSRDGSGARAKPENAEGAAAP